MNWEELIKEDEVEEDVVEPVDEYYSLYEPALNKINKKSPYFKYVLNSFTGGKSSYYNKIVREKKIFDSKWVDTLESYFPSIDNILRNPRSGLKYLDEIVAVEKAKKTTQEAVRHLASHTQYVKEVDEDDNVIPSKILNVYAEEDMELYENRFVNTLISRLYIFVMRRYENIRDNYLSNQTHRLRVTNTSKVLDEEVTVDLDIKVVKPLDEPELNDKNTSLLHRIEVLAKLITSYKNSQFCRNLVKSKPVHSPIMKTNVIIKNKDFRNCYDCWIFLDKYDIIDYQTDLFEKEYDIKDPLKIDLNKIMSNYYGIFNYYQEYRGLGLDELGYRRKRKLKKGSKLTADEMEAKDGKLEVENNDVNAYYLELTQRFFSGEYERLIEEEHKTFEQSVRSVVKQMIKITNRMYESLFEVRNDETYEVYNKIIGKYHDEMTLEDHVIDARYRIKVLDEVIGVKEADLKATKKERERQKKRLQKNLEAIERRDEIARRKAQREEERRLREALIAEERRKRALEREEARIRREEEKAALEKMRKERQEAKKNLALSMAYDKDLLSKMIAEDNALILDRVNNKLYDTEALEQEALLEYEEINKQYQQASYDEQMRVLKEKLAKPRFAAVFKVKPVELPIAEEEKPIKVTFSKPFRAKYVATFPHVFRMKEINKKLVPSFSKVFRAKYVATFPHIFRAKVINAKNVPSFPYIFRAKYMPTFSKVFRAKEIDNKPKATFNKTFVAYTKKEIEDRYHA